MEEGLLVGMCVNVCEMWKSSAKIGGWQLFSSLCDCPHKGRHGTPVRATGAMQGNAAHGYLFLYPAADMLPPCTECH